MISKKSLSPISTKSLPYNFQKKVYPQFPLKVYLIFPQESLPYNFHKKVYPIISTISLPFNFLTKRSPTMKVYSIISSERLPDDFLQTLLY